MRIKEEIAPSQQASSRNLRAFRFQEKPQPLRLRNLWRAMGKTEVSDCTAVIDTRGVIRLKLAEATLVESTAGALVADLSTHLDAHTQYDDGGITLPQVFALLGDRIIDLTRLQTAENFKQVLDMEAKDAPALEPAVLLFSQSKAEE